MLLAQHQLLRCQPAPVLIAEHAVLPAVRMRSLVLLPQQEARDTAAAQLGVQVREIRSRRTRERHCAPIHPGVQGPFIECWGKRPGDAGIARPAHALLHRGAGAADRSGYLSVAEALGLEPQDLTN